MQTEIFTGDLIRTADTGTVLSEGDTTNWSYELYIFKKNLDDTVRNYKTSWIRETCNEFL